MGVEGQPVLGLAEDGGGQGKNNPRYGKTEYRVGCVHHDLGGWPVGGEEQ